MWFTVIRAGVPIGAVDLPPRRLAAGRLVRAAGYAPIAARVRAASDALLEYGLYGPPASAIPDPSRRRARAALRAGATLALELRTIVTDEPVAVTFVSLFEAPDDGEVVVVVGFGTSPTGVPAAERGSSIPDRDRADPRGPRSGSG